MTAQYLSHLNPSATHFDALDLSSEALKVAKERAERADLVGNPNNANFHHMSLYDVADLNRKYDFINCVGVLHHLPDPNRGLRALAEQLKDGGLMHIFVYSALGRREIMLMQEALALLQGGKYEDFKEGVRLGRAVFAALPDDTRVKKVPSLLPSWYGCLCLAPGATTQRSRAQVHCAGSARMSGGPWRTSETRPLRTCTSTRRRWTTRSTPSYSGPTPSRI